MRPNLAPGVGVLLQAGWYGILGPVAVQLPRDMTVRGVKADLLQGTNLVLLPICSTRWRVKRADWAR